MNHTAKKYNEWDKEKHGNKETKKKSKSQSTKNFENSDGSSGVGKCLTYPSKSWSEFYTDYGMSQAKINKIIGLLNPSNWRDKMSHSPENDLI